MAFKAGKVTAIKTKSLDELGSSVVDLAKYIEDEFAQVASALQGNDPWQVLFVAPPKPRQGMLVYADGTRWNPGSGEGFYAYGSDAVWHWVEQNLSLPLSVANGGTGNAGGALTSYVVTVITGTGTVTGVGFWEQIGKKVFVSLILTFTSAVTGTVTLNIPVAAKRIFSVLTKETLINGHAHSIQGTASSTSVLLKDVSAGVDPSTNGLVIPFSFFYEAA